MLVGCLFTRYTNNGNISQFELIIILYQAHDIFISYSQAEEVFKELRALEPHQVRGMETYSTVLFHLQKEVAMSTLAQDMVAIDKTCAEVCMYE